MSVDSLRLFVLHYCGEIVRTIWAASIDDACRSAGRAYGLYRLVSAAEYSPDCGNLGRPV